MNMAAWLSIIIIPILMVVVDGIASVRARDIGYEFSDARNSDFTILVPIYGNTKYLENLGYLFGYGRMVTLCTTSGETPEFYESLEAIATRYGFKIFRSEHSASVDPTRRATSGTVRDRIVRDALHRVTTKYVIPLDADTVTKQRLTVLVGEIEHHGYDVVSVNLVPRDEKSWLVKLQRHEYRLAMKLRHIAPWMVSGACHAGRTTALREVMDRHSLFFQGNDVELGLIADKLGYRVGHIPFEVTTSVPNSLKAWFRQRLAWGGGEFRLFITNFTYIVRHPFFWIYGGLIAIAAFPLRWLALSDPGLSLLVIIVLLYLLVLYLHWRTRDRWVLLMPLYTFFSSFVMTPIGIFWYAYMAIKDRNLGVIRVGRREVLRRSMSKI